MNQSGSAVKQFIQGTVFYNYLFIIFQSVYNYLFRERLLDESIGAVYGTGKRPVLAIFILMVILAGTYAVFIKCRELRADNVKSAGITGFIVWVMNWVLVVFMVFTSVQAFGINISRPASDFENIVIICSILGSMIQAGFIIGFLARMSEPFEKKISSAAKRAGDVSAFIFLCVSYTVVWETIMYRSAGVHGRYDVSTGYGLLELTGWLVSFAMLYPPMRFPFILQEIHDIKEKRGRLHIALSYIAVIVSGIIPLIKSK